MSYEKGNIVLVYENGFLRKKTISRIRTTFNYHKDGRDKTEFQFKEDGLHTFDIWTDQIECFKSLQDFLYSIEGRYKALEGNLK